jgi:hypothetical protein
MLPHKPHRRASREITLDSWNLIRAGGGLASAAAGILLLVGHVLNLGGDPVYGTVPGASSVLTAHVLLGFALVALYAAQAERSGVPGVLGMVLGVAGTTLVSGVVLVEMAGASGANVEAVLGGASRARLPFWVALRSSSDSSCSARLRCGLACSHAGPDSS